MAMARRRIECEYCGGRDFHKNGVEWRSKKTGGRTADVVVCADKPLGEDERIVRMPRGFLGTELRVWSNERRPVHSIEPRYNFLSTYFCTDERHQKCMERCICQASEPQCENDKFKTAGMDRSEWGHIEACGTLDQQINQRRKRDARLAKVLGDELEACKPYVLSWRPCPPVNKKRRARKKRCRPTKK